MDPGNTGVVRPLGNLPPRQAPAASSDRPLFGSTPHTPPIPRGQWKTLIDTKFRSPSGAERQPFYLPPVHNQGRTNMCNCSATTAAMEIQRAKQGLDYTQLSAGDLYSRIHQNGDGGSYLEDGIRVSMEQGVASADVVDYLDWQSSTSSAAADRKNYRVTEAYLCPTFELCMSAVLRGFPLISGIDWYYDYEELDQGWLPRNPRSRQGGHAVMGYMPTYRMAGGQPVFGIWHQNSWGDTWGVGGRGVFPEDVYTAAVGGWWAVVQVVSNATPGADLPPTPTP